MEGTQLISMEQSDDVTALAKALVLFQKEMPTVPKTKVNPFYNSLYADLSSVTQAAAPIATKHGLAVVQLGGFDGQHDLLTTQVLHESGQWIRGTFRLLLTKQDAQQQGSAITYLRRYAYCAMLGIVADEDDDGNSASVSAQPAATKAAAPKTTRVKAPTSTTADPEGDYTPGGASKRSVKRLFAVLNGNKSISKNDEARHIWASNVLGIDVTSFNDLDQPAVTKLNDAASQSEPTEVEPPEYANDDDRRPF